MPGQARREDERLADPELVAVGDETKASEVHLELATRRRIVHAHRRLPAAGPAALDAVARQRAVRDLDAATGKQDPDLHDGEVVVHPLLDLVVPGGERAPGGAVAVGAVRTHRLDHLADQPVAELLLAAAAVQTQRDAGGDVAPRRLAIDADRPGDRALALTSQPPSECLFDLHHRDLPERHGASSALASETQPSDSAAGVGGWSGGPMTGNAGGPMPLAKLPGSWSHLAGKRQGLVYRLSLCRRPGRP